MEILIGQGDDCHYLIPADIVSRHHCRLIKDNDRFVVIDLGSTNGTFVRRIRIAPDSIVPLAPGEEVLISGSIPLDWGVVRQLFSWIEQSGLASHGTPAPAKRADIRPATPAGFVPPPAPRPSPSPRSRGIPPPQAPAPGPVEDDRGNERGPAGRDPAFRNDLVYAAYAHKSFTGKAFFTLVLYYLGFWIGGVIANFLFLGEAKRARNVTGMNPSGMGCLNFLIVTHFYLPLFLVIILIVLLITGLSHLGNMFDGFPWRGVGGC